jgi:regulator of sirC expression with transglutaminase-like and TPR domain
MEAREVRRRFTELVSRPSGEFRLAESALLIAQEESPHLELAAYLHRLDAMAARITARLGLELDPQRIVAAINTALFEEEGFRGNQDNYYDARNSFLNEVLDRKTGIPITLSVVYLDLGRQVGLPIVGVGLPGHFIVQYRAHNTPFWIDPFHRGQILSREDCITRVTQFYGQELAWQDAFLQPVSDHAILTRMLNNLKAIYVHQRDYRRALGAVERLVLLLPDSSAEIRDRGLLHAQLGHLDTALDDLEHYLQLARDAPDASVISRHIAALRQQLRR